MDQSTKENLEKISTRLENLHNALGKISSAMIVLANEFSKLKDDIEKVTKDE